MSWDDVATKVKPLDPKPTDPWDSKSQDEVLLHWQSLQTDLAKAKEQEMSFRKYVVSRAFPQKVEGTNTLALGNGYELKAGIKYNYKLDGDNEKIEAALDELANAGNEGPFLADRLVSWIPSLSIKEYRELSPQYKNIIDKVITITDAAPTLEIKEPKVKK